MRPTRPRLKHAMRLLSVAARVSLETLMPSTKFCGNRGKVDHDLRAQDDTCNFDRKCWQTDQAIAEMTEQ